MTPYQPPATVELPQCDPACAVQLRADLKADSDRQYEMVMARLAQYRQNAEAKHNAARAEALALYERAAKLALRMGEGARVCRHDMKRYSAQEISDMAFTLSLALDKVAAGVPGYSK